MPSDRIRSPIGAIYNEKSVGSGTGFSIQDMYRVNVLSVRKDLNHS